MSRVVDLAHRLLGWPADDPNSTIQDLVMEVNEFDKMPVRLLAEAEGDSTSRDRFIHELKIAVEAFHAGK